MAKATLVFLAVIAMALMLAQPVSAGALTSVVEDPVGDTRGPPGIKPAPHQDIVETSITLKDGRFMFVMDLAVPMPDNPPLPAAGVRLYWLWSLDTDPETFPAGFPFAPGDARPAEFFVLMLWDGVSFTGIVIDRRPLLMDGEAIMTSVPLRIKGAEVTLSVDSALVGNPSSLTWKAVTGDFIGAFGSDGEWGVDEAPNGDRANWPS